MSWQSKEGLVILGITVLMVPVLWMAWQVLFWVHVIGFISLVIWSIWYR
jgi:hypothetical protein